jgi:hypothetical protein
MRLMAGSGQNRAGHQPTQSLAPACRLAALVSAGLVPGPDDSTRPAFSCRHGRRGLACGRMRRPGATRGFASPGQSQDHQRYWLPVWHLTRAPAGPVLDHLTSVQRTILAHLGIPLPWPEKSV